MRARAANGRAGEGDWMRIFAIGDLHLSGAQPKSMDVFGRHWARHWDRIRANWREVVQPQDVVLVPGDISWAMDLGGAQVDLDEICQMPGQKVLLRGNHDYWWSSLSRVRAALWGDTYALQNDCIRLGDVAVCGTRGWLCPNPGQFSAQDEKIYNRELGRMELSLKAFQKTGLPTENLVVMTHYPPFNDHQEPSGFTALYAQYGVKRAVYGHLHGAGLRNAYEGTMDGVQYFLTSCDYLEFKLQLIAQI